MVIFFWVGVQFHDFLRWARVSIFLMVEMYGNLSDVESRCHFLGEKKMDIIICFLFLSCTWGNQPKKHIHPRKLTCPRKKGLFQ